MEKRSAWYAFVVFGALLTLSFGFLALLLHSLRSESEWGEGDGPRIGIVEISGPITESQKALKRLHQLRENKKIRAIVVRIDSPGGAVAPSQEIYQAILRARRDKKVVCSLGTLAASGGYYVASACDRIFASAGTITGSIGVISELPHVGRLLEMARVEVDTIKSGSHKDLGSPLRPMTVEERQFFQHFVDGVYDQFLSDVATSRKLDKEELRPIADGRILTGKEALAAHLVDDIGNLEDAIDGAAKLAGAAGKPVPQFPAEPGRGLLVDLLRGSVDGLTPRHTIEVRDPRF